MLFSIVFWQQGFGLCKGWHSALRGSLRLWVFGFRVSFFGSGVLGFGASGLEIGRLRFGDLRMEGPKPKSVGRVLDFRVQG